MSLFNKDARENQLGASLAENTSHISNLQIDVKVDFGAKGDGVTDDTNAIQNAINSLIGKTGTVYFPYGTYKITSTLLIPDTIQLRGAMTSRYGRANSDTPSTVIMWSGVINSKMITFNNNGAKVFGARIVNLAIDGNSIAGVIGVDLTNSSYTKLIMCNFTRVAVGVQLSNIAYYNDILFSNFEYFTDCGIKFVYVDAYTNDITIFGNSFYFVNPNTKGVYVTNGNAIRIGYNRFEGSVSGVGFVIVESGSCKDVVIQTNRMESEFNIDNGDTPIYAIWIKKDGSNTSPINTRITGNQIYSQEFTGGVGYTNGLYDVLDEGFGTIFDQKHSINYIPNGACLTLNGIVPIWRTNKSYMTFSSDSVSGRMKLNIAGATDKYPFAYNITDANPYRGKNLTISVKFKVDNITTSPQIEVNCYKGGNGSVTNLGTFQVSNTTNLRAYKANADMVLFSTISIPSDADTIFVNINGNGNNSSAPADNNIYVDYVCLSELKAVFLMKSQDHVYSRYDKAYTSTNRPTGTLGLRVFDSTLNKPIWFNGANWHDSNNVNPDSRGINVAVLASATTLSVTFLTAESDANYAVSVSLSWNTTYWITNKTTSGFTINFGTAPASASALDWSIRR